jgi:hypothetical protein
MKISDFCENISAGSFATSMGGGNGFKNGGIGTEPLRRNKKKKVGESLPPHLAKMFDKDGNKKKGKWINGKWVADKKQPKQHKFTVTDVTPKGYGPDESVHAMNKEDPNNPEVLIQGYGRMSMNTLKASIARMLDELAKKAESDDWEFIAYQMENGVFTAKLKALMDAIQELEGIRKKGGPKSRGINKR